MKIFDRTRVQKCALDHGWENIIASNQTNVIAGSARHSVQAIITRPSLDRWSISFDKPLLVKELLRSFDRLSDDLTLSIDSLEQLPSVLRRAAELALSLPNQAVDTFQSRVKKELGEIQNTNTEVERLVKQRVGQSTFREALMDYWDRSCAITGINIPEVLRASHAKPWAHCESDEERLDVFNGFLLSANLDALFDRGLISFDDNGVVLISRKLSIAQLACLGISDKMRLRWVASEHATYLNWHRGHWFQAD